MVNNTWTWESRTTLISSLTDFWLKLTMLIALDTCWSNWLSSTREVLCIPLTLQNLSTDRTLNPLCPGLILLRKVLICLWVHFSLTTFSRMKSSWASISGFGGKLVYTRSRSQYWHSAARVVNDRQQQKRTLDRVRYTLMKERTPDDHIPRPCMRKQELRTHSSLVNKHDVGVAAPDWRLWDWLVVLSRLWGSSSLECTWAIKGLPRLVLRPQATCVKSDRKVVAFHKLTTWCIHADFLNYSNNRLKTCTLKQNT